MKSKCKKKGRSMMFVSESAFYNEKGGFVYIVDGLRYKRKEQYFSKSIKSVKNQLMKEIMLSYHI